MPQRAEPLAVARILVADADDSARQAFLTTFQSARCEIIEAADGRDALVHALTRPSPTLVVADAQLPLIDGYALCELLRRDAAMHAVPIIIVTTDAGPLQTERGRVVGADSVLVRPYPADRLLTEARRLIERTRGLQRPANIGAGAVIRRPRSAERLACSREQRSILARAHQRFATTTPALRPPELHCPSCDGPLKYERSHVGGVSEHHPEQWDYYVCLQSCGSFQYRQRTRKLRRIT